MDSNNNAKCKDLSNDQKALLARTLTRMKAMHTEPSAFVLALTLRANDMPTENLEQVRAWLAEHQADPVPPDRWATPVSTKPESGNIYDIPKGISENVIDISAPGVHDRQGEGEKDMAGNIQTAPQQTAAKTWMEIDDENSTGSYVSFKSGDRKILKIVTNPIAGQIEFKQPNGTTKSNFGLTIEVLEGENPEIKEWSVTSKQIRDQLKAICRLEGLLDGNIAGSIIRVAANGDGLQRTYFVEMIQKPDGQPARGYAMPGQPQRPAQQPTPQDQGQAWLQQQRQGAQ